MGITIYGKTKSIDLGYFGFNRLRNAIGDLLPKDLAQHHRDCEKSILIFGEEKRKEFFKKYNAKTEELDKKYNYKYNYILHFLYACDCEATMSVDVCKELYNFIKDYDDDIAYGYTGRDDCAMFKDFKEVVKDCIDNNIEMEWS